jgi:CO/xanthine dehydrogenase FAD-binding subunit
MIMKFEKYFRPASLQEALDLMKEYKGEYKLIAGGTDVVIRLKAHALRVKTIIDISRVPELTGVRVEDGKLYVGANTRLMDLSKNPDVVNSEWEILAECAGHVSSTQVRNVATLAGNNVNASPSADTTPALLMCDAIVHIAGPDGQREDAIDDFLLGPGKVDLKDGEIVTGFTFPKQGDNSQAAYIKFAIRGDTDIAIVNAGARIGLDADGKVSKARLVLGAVAPRSIRMKEVEDFLIGKKMTKEVIEEAAVKARDSITPITDQRATAAYRKQMAYVNLRNAMQEAVEKLA